MRYLCVGIILLLSAAPLAADERFDVRVLYCGDPGSEREAVYRSFLAQHFTKVTLRDLRKFKEEDANRQDVVIFDWTYLYNGKGQPNFLKLLRLPERTLSVGFAHPTILIGPAGAKISASLKLKVAPLCICLNGPAHHLRLKHPLFHAPLEVDPKLEQMPTPEGYSQPFPTIDPTLGATMTVWNVQTKNYPEIDNGVVSTLYGFNDSPDAEVIAQGISLKGPDTVALGRHANFFLWGFSAPPTDMTAAGKRLFVNVVCYMRQFDGQTPLVRRESQAREWALLLSAEPRFLSQDDIQKKVLQYRAAFQQHPEWIPAKYKGNPDGYALEMVQQARKRDEQRFKKMFPEPLRKKFGMDADKYVAYYKENFEYLRPEGWLSFVFDVDEEAKTVGPSNRSVEMLERCVAKLEKHEQPDLALRLLKRHTQEKFETASQWRAWLDANRGRLFFSDVGGYKFFVAPTEKPGRTTTLSTRK
jgi:hypothetical protein